ncbi:MAG TPA: hypothetical protein VFN71_10990 [Methylomirabilota bacterium]|nr:hypothetical protein [Methylomirabilota bacterium]
MAAPTLKRLAWPAAAVVAAAFITVLAFHGQRPEPGLARFEAAGLMPMPPADVTQVEVAAGGKHWRLARGADGRWQLVEGAPGAPGDLQDRVEKGLKLLHASGPERVLTREELSAASTGEFGLSPAELSVSARGGAAAAFTLHFGRKNPLGLARYARVEGREDVVLLPGFVAEAWEAVVRSP